MENIDIPVEKAKESIPVLWVNTNEEQNEEEVVVIGAKQPEKNRKKKLFALRWQKLKLTNQVKLVSFNYP